MDKNKFIFLSGGLLFASIGNTVQGQEAVAMTERPNVIYLLCDDMGYSDIEAYGQQMISTPNLTYLVNNGMSFTQFSRASLMTGQHTGHTKIRGNKEIQPDGRMHRSMRRRCSTSVEQVGESHKRTPDNAGAYPRVT